MKTLISLILSLIFINCYKYDENFAKNIAFHVSQIAYCNNLEVNDWVCDTCKYFPNMKDYKMNSYP